MRKIYTIIGITVIALLLMAIPIITTCALVYNIEPFFIGLLIVATSGEFVILWGCLYDLEETYMS